MRQQGFTLIELSVVLVVIGLLIGAVAVGQTLIHSAELRSVITDREKYITALRSFETKYSAIAGDMSNATRFWGARDGGDGLGVDCTAAVSTNALTCNGDGNGLIANMEDGSHSNEYESYRAWQHLANAELISNPGLTGALYTTTIYAVPGVNIPKTRIKGLGFHVHSNASTGYVAWMYPPGINGHFFELGGNNTIDGHYYNGKPILTVKDSYYFDSKIDDGTPDNGTVRTFIQSGTCYAGVAPNITYDLTNANLRCTLLSLFTM